MENEKLFKLMTQMYSEMTEGFNRLSYDINRLDSEMTEVKKTLMHIEHDHGKKLEVIINVLAQHTDQLNRIEKRLDKHDDIILKYIK
jgi:flagellar capping protein FliD